MPVNGPHVHTIFTVFLETREKMTAARFVDLAMDKIREVHAEGRLPILVGGTGMYLRSLLSGIAPIPEIPEEIRTGVLERIRADGPQALHAELTQVDPEYAARIHPNDNPAQRACSRGLPRHRKDHDLVAYRERAPTGAV